MFLEWKGGATTWPGYQTYFQIRILKETKAEDSSSPARKSGNRTEYIATGPVTSALIHSLALQGEKGERKQ